MNDILFADEHASDDSPPVKLELKELVFTSPTLLKFLTHDFLVLFCTSFTRGVETAETVCISKLARQSHEKKNRTLLL